ncbi:MAG: CpsB/CapC family capsule biosynthesis tyrosine phosphatase, partial [Desulfotomaculales bacterium]
MVDLHTHILPGLDDGARNEEEALEMAACAAADGIAGLIATPHFIQGQFTPSRQEILAAVGRLNAGLGGAGVPVEVLPGAEYRLEPDLPERLRRGGLLTLNDAGRHLLVELP